MADSKRLCAACGAAIPPGLEVCPRCATRDLDVADLADAPAIEGYRILGRLGQGGMGAVYLAEDETLHRSVAIKLVHRALASQGEVAARERFLREARAMARVEHPGIVRVYGFGRLEDNDYLVMELVPGRTLREEIQQRGALAPVEALRILLQVVEALEAAWEARIVHRDIKPSNILLDVKGRVRVADFGLARSAAPGDRGLTRTGQILGTPDYLAPEQAREQPVDFRSDLYSLGIVLYEMLTGQTPFAADSPLEVIYRHLHEDLPPIAAGRQVPPELEDLVVSLTRRDMAGRPSSHAAVRERIGSILRGMEEEEGVELRGQAPGRRARWPAPPVIAVAGVVLALLLVLAWLGVHLRGPSPAPPVAAAATLPPTGSLVIAVSPFYGPEPESEREGRVIASLLERELRERLGTTAEIVGLDRIPTPVRSDRQAIALSRELGALITVWGEALTVHGDTELVPAFTVAPAAARSRQAAMEPESPSPYLPAAALAQWELSEESPERFRLDAGATDQIQLRRTTASELGAIVSFMLGIHSLSRQEAEEALSHLAQAPATATTMRYQALALLQLGKAGEAEQLLLRALESESEGTGAAYALLGDALMEQGRLAEAAESYRAAATSGEEVWSFAGAWLDNLLWVPERIRVPCSTGPPRETRYLLGIDPVAQRVRRRYYLPGPLRSLTLRGEALEILYEHLWGQRQSTIRLTPEGFDRYPFYGPSLHARPHSTRLTLALAENLLLPLLRLTPGEPPATGRVSLGDVVAQPCPELPADLESLELVAAEALERDPTQPWHPFLLGAALQGQGRGDEAEEVWSQLFEKRYPGSPYFDFARMAEYFERLGLPSWADRAMESALARRRALPWPIWGAQSIERTVNAPNDFRRLFPDLDPLRAHQRLQQVRELSGPVPETDPIAALAWARYLREQGLDELAQREMAFARRAASGPLSITREAALLDYNLLIFRGLAPLPLVLLALALIATASSRSPAGPRSRLIEWWRRLGTSLPRPLGVAALAAGLGLLPWTIVVAQSSPLHPAAWLLGSLLVLALWPLMAGLGGRHLLSIGGALLVLLTAFAFYAHRYVGTMTVGDLPHGFSDSLGHPDLGRYLERRAHLVPSAGPYAAAVALHLAGDGERARELYTLAGSSQARDNLRTLERGEPPRHQLTIDELHHGLLGSKARRLGAALRPDATVTWLRELPGAVWPVSLLGVALPVTTLVLVLTLLLSSWRPGGAVPSRPVGWQIWVPGFPALVEGRPFRALVLLAGLGVSVSAVRGFQASIGLGMGPVTTSLAPSPRVIDLPPGFPASLSRWQLLDWGLLAAYPGAHIFWGAVSLLALLSLGLYVHDVWKGMAQRSPPVSG